LRLVIIKPGQKQRLLSGGFKYLEHITDAYIEAWGDSLEEAFSYAATAVVNVMFEIKNIRGTSKTDFQVEGEDYLELLFNWLEKVLLLISIDNQVISSFEIKISEMDTKYRLTGWGMAESIDISQHNYRTEIKGITYHEMEVLQEVGQYKVRFILDL
jgi:SHS2 domain-containing protein